MVPKIHAKGTSFVEATRYVMHDKKATTSERVAWSQTVNLGTQNPEAAAKVMAYTALDSARRKKECGIPNTGRKSNKHVFHATLSWHPDEADKITKEGQLSAAKWFLKKLGATDRQALIVAHRDQEQPHVHIVMNRVSSQDGRMLSSSLERLKASEWAEKYERERGQIYCDQRVINNQARERGEHTRGRKNEPAHFIEMRDQAAKLKQSKEAVEKEIQKRKQAHRLKKMTERIFTKKAVALDEAIHEKTKQMKLELDMRIARSRQDVQGRFREKWEEEYFEQQAQLAEFTLREKGLRGKISNVIEAINLRSHEEGKKSLSEPFSAMGRMAILKRQQAYREQEIKREQNFEELKAVQQTRREWSGEMVSEISAYRQERERLEKHYQKRQETINTIRLHRQRVWREKMDALEAAREQQKTQKVPKAAEQTRAGNSPSEAPKTKPSHLLPKDNAAARARQIDQYKERIQGHQAEKRRDRDRKDGRGGRGR